MAFIEEQFPVGVSYGALGGPMFNTGIQQFGSGDEQRNQNWEKHRCEYDVAHGVKDQSELNELLNFFYARRGRLEGFRFKDWQDFTMARQSIGTGDGADKTWQVYKRYESAAGTPYDRNLLKIVAASVTVWLNSVEQGSGWTLDYDTGILTFTVAPTNTHDIEFACEFDVPCRFDTDQMFPSIDFYQSYSWGQIPLVELKNPA